MSGLSILFIGDIIGRPGRRAVRENIDSLSRVEDFDLIIANAENGAGGFGLTGEVIEELLGYGVDVITTGNHVWDKKEGIDHIENNERVLRPLNYPPGNPGRGYGLFTGRSGLNYLVANLSGRVFMGNFDCPFRAADAMLENNKQRSKFTIVDFHAEATSEKEAMGYYLDGRVSGVIGTHTHVQTADECILPEGTGYITDAGMCGPLNSIIGMKKDHILRRFLSQMPVKFEVASGPVLFSGVVLELDDETGMCRSIRRVYEKSD